VRITGSTPRAYRNYVLADGRPITLCTPCLAADSTLRWLATVLPSSPPSALPPRVDSRSWWPRLKRWLIATLVSLLLLDALLLLGDLRLSGRLQAALLVWLLLTFAGVRLRRRWQRR